MVPPDLTKKKSGVAAGQARVEEFKRKEREAKLKADEEARKAAEAQQRAENGANEEEDKKESSSEDEEAQGRRRLERRGRAWVGPTRPSAGATSRPKLINCASARSATNRKRKRNQSKKRPRRSAGRRPRRVPTTTMMLCRSRRMINGRLWPNVSLS